MAHPPAERPRSDLVKRTLSSLVMAPPVLVAVQFGSPYFEVLTMVLVAVMAWEWVRLCAGPAARVEVVLLAGALSAAVAVVSLGRPGSAVALVAVGAVAIEVVGHRHLGNRGGTLWLGLGGLYIGLACVAIVWLRYGAGSGRETVLWLLLVVWAVDVGSYAAGRLFGGRKLAPSVSPGKTWAGLVGGLVCAALVGAGAAAVLGRTSLLPLTAASFGIGAMAQAGDLAESWAKRRFGVKDSSHLIPGQGGLLDRVDGLLAAGAAAGAVSALGQRGILTWM